MLTPRYSIPLRLFPRLITSLLAARPRSFRADSCLCIRQLDPPLSILGRENLPTAGPCALTVNHYHRAGFGAWWISLAIATAVPHELCWIMTAEWTFPGRWYGFLGQPASRWVLKRAAKMYDFITMPPMPPRSHEVMERTRSVRMVLEHLHHHPGTMLALSPEGADNSGGVLAWPPPGAGRFLLLMAKQGLPFIPVGCWEENGTLCLNFGPAYRLVVGKGNADERDKAAAGTVMRFIAGVLPPNLRGDFS